MRRRYDRNAARRSHRPTDTLNTCIYELHCSNGFRNIAAARHHVRGRKVCDKDPRRPRLEPAQHTVGDLETMRFRLLHLQYGVAPDQYLLLEGQGRVSPAVKKMRKVLEPGSLGYLEVRNFVR